MSDPRLQELPAEWLDNLVLDMAELEALVERLKQSLGAISPADAPKGALSVQILDALVRVSGTAGALRDLASGRLRSLATTMAAASDNEEPGAASAWDPEPAEADRSEPASRRAPMSVR